MRVGEPIALSRPFSVTITGPEREPRIEHRHVSDVPRIPRSSQTDCHIKLARYPYSGDGRERKASGKSPMLRSGSIGADGLFRHIHHKRAPCPERTGFPVGVEHCVVVRRGARDVRVTQPPLRLQPIRGSSR